MTQIRTESRIFSVIEREIVRSITRPVNNLRLSSVAIESQDFKKSTAIEALMSHNLQAKKNLVFLYSFISMNYRKVIIQSLTSFLTETCKYF